MTIENERKKLIMRRGSLALMLLILSVLQNTEGFFPQVFGVRALILIPAVVCIAMYERDIAGMFFGLFAGALWDTAASGASFNALYLLAVGFICGTLINTVMRNNIVTATLLCSVFIPLYHVGYWFFRFVAGGLDSGKFMFLRYYLPGIGYTLLFAPIMFIIVRGIEKYYTED